MPTFFWEWKWKLWVQVNSIHSSWLGLCVVSAAEGKNTLYGEMFSSDHNISLLLWQHIHIFHCKTPFPFSSCNCAVWSQFWLCAGIPCVVFEEHIGIFLWWLSAASLITYLSLGITGKETNNKSPRSGMALWLHFRLCWFYKLLKTEFEKCQHRRFRGFFAIFSLPHPSPQRIKNLYRKCLWKGYKTPLPPKLPKTVTVLA